MFMVFFVLEKPDDSEAVLPAWKNAGATGVTILRSTGIGRMYKRSTQWDDLPLFPSIEDLFRQEEDQNRTLITVVKDRETVDRIIQVTQEITGDLDLPDSGVLFVLPVIEAYGLNPRDNND